MKGTFQKSCNVAKNSNLNQHTFFNRYFLQWAVQQTRNNLFILESWEVQCLHFFRYPSSIGGSKKPWNCNRPSTASLLWHVLFIKLFFSRTKYHGQRYSNHRSFIDSCNSLKANTIKLYKFPQSMSYHCNRSNMMSKNSATTLESCRTLHLRCRVPCPTV